MLPVNPAGAVPAQIVCAALIVLLAIAGVTVIAIAVETSEQEAEDTVLLYQVFVVKAPGE